MIGIPGNGAAGFRYHAAEMNITVSELIVRFMERLGVTHVFGMPGAHILPVYDRLYDSAIATVSPIFASLFSLCATNVDVLRWVLP